MDHNDINKLINFIKTYQTLYGNNLFVDADRISNLAQELPDFQMKETLSKQKSETNQQPRKHEESKPDSPLWNFMREIKDCTNCPLGHSRTNFVFGTGNETADLMFIGEAPGAEEDRTGIPFVGRAGKLLDKLLQKVYLKREDVFIANILKCRPPNNRDPKPEEVDECIPYLHKQIELIKPKVIVALGRVAAQNLLETTDSLKVMRNRLWQYRGITMIVTYHPAAILRNAGLYNASLADFEFIKDTLNKAKEYQTS